MSQSRSSALQSGPRTKEDQVVIVGGSFEVEPDQREAFLAGRRDAITTARAEAGCLEYAVTADPIEPGRVVLYERWADQASLDAHLAAARQAPPPPPGGVAPKSATIIVYDVSGERKLA
jgi:quinol monooxygenase YgiN